MYANDIVEVSVINVFPISEHSSYYILRTLLLFIAQMLTRFMCAIFATSWSTFISLVNLLTEVKHTGPLTFSDILHMNRGLLTLTPPFLLSFLHLTTGCCRLTMNVKRKSWFAARTDDLCSRFSCEDGLMVQMSWGPEFHFLSCDDGLLNQPRTASKTVYKSCEFSFIRLASISAIINDHNIHKFVTLLQTTENELSQGYMFRRVESKDGD